MVPYCLELRLPFPLWLNQVPHVFDLILFLEINFHNIYVHVCVRKENADDIALLANAPETLLHSLERAAAGIYLHFNAHKTECTCFNQTGDISTLNGISLKLVDKFIYLGSSVSSTEAYISMRLAKAWTGIDRLSVIWKSELTDKIKRSFFKAVVVSILLYGCTTWTLTERMEKRLDGNYTRMLQVILNKSLKVAAVWPLNTHLENYQN